jgi:hypothetical protein
LHFFQRFTDHGYVVGKLLLPDGVAFKQYGLDDEDIIGPQFQSGRVGPGRW